MRREAIQSVMLTSASGVVCTEMVYKLHAAGYRFAETPVNHYPRLHGQSQFFTLRRVARTGYDFFKLWLKLVIGGRLIFGLENKRKYCCRDALNVNASTIYVAKFYSLHILVCAPHSRASGLRRRKLMLSFRRISEADSRCGMTP